MDAEATLLGRFTLAFLDFFIAKLLHPATLQADDVIMVVAVIQLKYRLVCFEVMPYQQPGLLKLGEHTIHRGQSYVLAGRQQLPIDIFGRQVAPLAGFKQR